jgi:hypothetical protein
MSKLRGFGVGLVFLVGCAVGGAAGGAAERFVVPPASAQQAATLTKWEYVCMRGGNPNVTGEANRLGLQGWEMSGAVGAVSGGGGFISTDEVWCFKRPKL